MQFLPSPVLGLAGSVFGMSVSQSVTLFSTSSSLHWTIILLLFMLVYLFSSNYSVPSTGGGISSDLCRSNSLGTSHSRHESESEWLAVSAKWLESVKSHSTGLETKSAYGLDCENSPSTGLVYKWGVWKWGLGIVSLCKLVCTIF